MRLLFLIISLVLTLSAFANEKFVKMDSKFFRNFRRTAPMYRDEICDGLLKVNISANGTVIAVKKIERFGKSSMAIVRDDMAFSKYGINLEYHIYMRELAIPLSVGSRFEFRGAMVMFTPYSMKRDGYIFDIIVIDGNMVIE